MRKVPAAERTARVAAALELARLTGLDARYPRQLSGGQQQRVAVARAIVIRPSVLLFDEPLSNLDARLRQAMRDELRELQRTLRIATILVTHDQDEALSLADRIVVMHAGRVEQVGTPETIYTRPATPFVAEFIGQCNFLSGHVHAPDGSAPVFRADDGLTFALAPGASVSHGQRGLVALPARGDRPPPPRRDCGARGDRGGRGGAERDVSRGPPPVPNDCGGPHRASRVDCQVGPLGYARPADDGGRGSAPRLAPGELHLPARRRRAGAGRERRVTRSAWRPWLLLAPSLVILLGVFVIPLGILGRYSFYRTAPGGAMVPAWTLDQYARFLLDAHHLRVLGATLALALGVTWSPRCSATRWRTGSRGRARRGGARSA
jgi:hypothetical protein